jgi:PAS domain S-box-containing protein
MLFLTGMFAALCVERPPMYKTRRFPFLRYGIAVVSIVLATLLRLWLDPILDDYIPFTTYYAAIMFTAWYGGLGPSIAALISGALLASYLFVEPRRSLMISNLEHQVGMLLFLLVGIVVSLLTESLREGRRRMEAARADLAAANNALQKEITERKQAERWLLESEERFRSYFEQGLVGMAILSPQRDWIEVNERLSRMLGYQELELPAATWRELTPPADRDAEERYFQRIEEGLVSGFTLDKRFLCKGGKIITASVWARALRDAEGTLKGVLVLVQDISVRKKAEDEALASQQRILEMERVEKQHVQEELTKAKDRLVRQTRLASLGQISAGIAHELRNPLSAVRMAVYYLLRTVPEEESKSREYLGMIDEEAQQAEQIITDLTAMSRGAPPEKKPVALDQIVAEARGRVNPPAGIQWHEQYQPQPLVVSIDPAQFEFVLKNLFVNALAALRQSGTISVVGKRTEEGDEILVADDGSGIPPEAREHVFEWLYSTKSSGMGIGLALCQQIIESHGGTIELADAPRGTTFRIRLPLWKPADISGPPE